MMISLRRRGRLSFRLTLALSVFGCSESKITAIRYAPDPLSQSEAQSLAESAAAEAGCVLAEYDITMKLQDGDWLAFFDRKAPTPVLGGDNSFMVRVKPNGVTRVFAGL